MTRNTFSRRRTLPSRLPAALKKEIAAHGLRNSHLLSIAPTGTISLAFADNASNGIEPPYAWTYQRKKRMPDDTQRTYDVEDHAWRLFRQSGGDIGETTRAFRHRAGDFSAAITCAWWRSIAPFVDSAISKTVNVPENYPYDEFENLYFEAWKSGLKGHRHLPPEFGAGQRAFRRVRRRPPPSPTTSTPRTPTAASASTLRPNPRC